MEDTTPLASLSRKSSLNSPKFFPKSQNRYFCQDIAKEAARIFNLAWPVAISAVIEFGSSITNAIFLGHLGADDLAGSALANMFINTTGFAVCIGLVTAMDTLTSQAYGAKNFRLLGLISQRAALIITICCVPVSVLWTYCGKIMELLGQEPTVVEKADQYVKIMIFGIWPAFMFEVLKKHLQNQTIVKPCMLSVIAALIVNLVGNVVFVYILDWGFIGSPIATVLSQWTMFFVTIIYIILNPDCRKDFPALSWEVFQGWSIIFELGLPGMTMVLLEWMSFEVTTIYAGWIGTSQQAAHTILANTASIVFMLPLGFGVAVSIRVGSFLGDDKPALAKRTSLVGLVLTMTIMVLVCSLLSFGRYYWTILFTGDAQVIDESIQALPIQAMFTWLDGIQCIISGVLRGCGKQGFGAAINAIGYMFVSLPLAYVLGIHPYKKDLPGIWLGMVIGVFVVDFGLYLIMRTIDWEKESLFAMLRSCNEEEEEDDEEEGSSGTCQSGSDNSDIESESHTLLKSFSNPSICVNNYGSIQ